MLANSILAQTTAMPSVYAARSRPVDMMLPAAAPFLALAAGAATVMQMRKNKEERDSFFAMSWSDTVDSTADEGCVLIGEEAAEGGKQWFVCSEPDEGKECEEVSSYGAPALNGEAVAPEYLCKQPKVAD